MAALPATGISIGLVATTIGVGSNDLGRLICQASSGGVDTTPVGGTTSFKSAFKTNENASAVDVVHPEVVLGGLIPGSMPSWNIFSQYSPGTWIKDGGADDYFFSFKLKKFVLTHPYDFILGGFAQYDHNVVKPFVTHGPTLDIILSGSSPGTNETATVYPSAMIGDYTFDAVLGAYPQQIGVTLYNPSGTVIASGHLDCADSSAMPRESIQSFPITIPAGTSLKDGDLVTTRLYLSNDNDATKYYIDQAITTTWPVNIINHITPVLDSVTFTKKAGGLASSTFTTSGTFVAEATSFSLTVLLSDYISPLGQHKYATLYYTEDSNKIQVGDTKDIIQKLDTQSGSFSMDVPGGIQYGKLYSVEIVESDTPPLQ